MKKILLFLCVCFSLSLTAQNLDSTYVTGIVSAVHDGDSYRIKFDTDTLWCRLNFVDAPEVRSNYICSEQDMGKEVGNIVRSELKGKLVKVKFMGVDEYNRPLIRIYINEQDYATSLVRRGLAWVVDSKQLTKEEYKILINYKKIAVKQKLGIFSKSNYISPTLFRKRNHC